MQAVLQSHVSTIAGLRATIASSIAERYDLPFDGSSIQVDIYVALYHYWELKRKRISRTLQAIRRHGVIEAVNLLVARDNVSEGFIAFANNGMLDRTFEHVVLVHSAAFSNKARSNAIQRLI